VKNSKGTHTVITRFFTSIYNRNSSLLRALSVHGVDDEGVSSLGRGHLAERPRRRKEGEGVSVLGKSNGNCLHEILRLLRIMGNLDRAISPNALTASACELRDRRSGQLLTVSFAWAISYPLPSQGVEVLTSVVLFTPDMFPALRCH